MDDFSVCQIIYTNVEPKDSPNKRGGFQTLFYPTGMLDRKDLFGIEGRIHFIPGRGVACKETVFFTQIRGEPWLAVLCIRDCPDERDSFGRSGIFLCHGFLFPPELWKKIPSCSDLLKLVGEHVFSNREEALSSPYADREKGNIASIPVPAESVKETEVLTPLKPGAEAALALLLAKLATAPEDGENEKKPPLLIKGDTDAVSSALGRAMCRTPEAVRPRLGWDPFFEEGSFFHFPLKIVGFKKQPPFSGDHILVDLTTGQIDPGPFETFVEPQTPYEKWLAGECLSKHPREDVDMAFSYSNAILGEPFEPFADEFVKPVGGFIKANGNLLNEVFVTRTAEKAGKSVTDILNSQLDENTKLDLVYRNIETERLGPIVENILIKKKKKPNFLDMNRFSWIPDSTAAPRLRVMHGVWKGDEIRMPDLDGFSQDDRNDLFDYWMGTEKTNRRWLVELLQQDDVYRKKILELLIVKRKMKTGEILDLGFDTKEIAHACVEVSKYVPELATTLLENGEFDLAEHLFQIPLKLKGEKKTVLTILKGKTDIPSGLAEKIETIVREEEGRSIFNRIKGFLKK